MGTSVREYRKALMGQTITAVAKNKSFIHILLSDGTEILVEQRNIELYNLQN